MSFVGELNDKMKGFYRSKYTIDGEERFGAVTQFEVHSIICKYLTHTQKLSGTQLSLLHKTNM